MGTYHATVFVELEAETLIKSRQLLAQVLFKNSKLCSEKAIITMIVQKDMKTCKTGDPWMDKKDLDNAKQIRESQEVKYTFYNPETDESKDKRHKEVVERKEKREKEVQFKQTAEMVDGKLVFSKK